ncbi:MAG: ammonium transporter [Methanomassiliicoccales archaeon]|nr:ammonium transporter [Methanomassiliicoccales archaeon]MDD1755231.1 ammonium transporter [Methanomassiliicoccales archaeon]
MAIDTGNTAWVLISAALVFIMTPAVGFFYGGMLGKKNVLSILGQSIIIVGMVTLIWVTVGFTLSFGGNGNDLIGNFDWVMLDGVGIEPLAPYDLTSIPGILFMMFQGMFAIITVALIIGGVAERMKLRALIIFLFAWTLLVYIPVAHWVWGGGWIAQLGALDFAGGTVVHITAGVSVLAAVIVLGKRTSLGNGGMERPHNIPFVVLGGALLWIGWFGFNGGSALAADGIAANAFVVTMVAAATAAIVWGLVNWLHSGRPGVLGMISGAIAGLVAITPACGYVNVTGAIAIGMGAGVFCYGGILLKRRFDYDDALDVFGVHGVGGTWGALATGLFATGTLASTSKGLFYGGGLTLLGAQMVAVGVVYVFAFGVTSIALFVMKRFMAIRMSKEEERIGADIIQHGENAYS